MSTRQRSDKTAKYKTSFIYITPNSLAKICFILGPISITPILYKNQVSGHGFWTKFFMIFSYTQCISQQYVFKIHGRIQDFRLELKKNNNRGAERGENFFWCQDFMQKSYFFYLLEGIQKNARLTSNPYINQDILNHSFTKQKF